MSDSDIELTRLSSWGREALALEIIRLQAALDAAEKRAVWLTMVIEGIQWKSADKDNMEFVARITYSQMDAIRDTLASPQAGSKESGK